MIRKLLLILPLVLTLAWILFIFSNSLENATESGQKSDAVKEVVDHVAEELGHPEGVNPLVIRKSGHVVEFLVLGLLLVWDLIACHLLSQKLLSLKNLGMLGTALGISAVVACCDELLQRLSAGRVSSGWDVLIDLCGAIGGILLFCSVYYLCSYIRKRKREKERA